MRCAGGEVCGWRCQGLRPCDNSLLRYLIGRARPESGQDRKQLRHPLRWCLEACEDFGVENRCRRVDGTSAATEVIRELVEFTGEGVQTRARLIRGVACTGAKDSDSRFNWVVCTRTDGMADDLSKQKRAAAPNAVPSAPWSKDTACVLIGNPLLSFRIRNGSESGRPSIRS